MEIEYNNSKVTWCYNGENIEYCTNGIESASDDMGSIYIEVYYEDIYEYQYVSLKGELILSYCEDTKDITIMDKDNKKRVINIPLLREVSLGCNKRFLVLTGDDYSSKLLVYTFQGEKINEYLPPSGYTFYRFAQVGNEVNVVCQGSEKSEDKFGRNDWNFTLNVDTGEWKRQSLAY